MYFVWISAEVSLVLACCWIVLNDVLYQVYAARPQRSERYWVQWGWVSVKKLHSILYSHWGPKTDRAGWLRQMGRAYWNAILLSGLVGAFWAMFISTGPMCSCMSVCLCVFDILGTGGERGQIAASLSHIIGQLSFIHRNERVHLLPLSTPQGMIHAFVLYCLLKNT